MHETIQKMARAFAKQREQRRRACAGFTALAILVSISTTYLLVRPANTLAADYYCGYEAHIHTEECFERVLICGYDTEEDGGAIIVPGGDGGLVEWLPPEEEIPEEIPPVEGEIPEGMPPVEGEVPEVIPPVEGEIPAEGEAPEVTPPAEEPPEVVPPVEEPPAEPPVEEVPSEEPVAPEVTEPEAPVEEPEAPVEETPAEEPKEEVTPEVPAASEPAADESNAPAESETLTASSIQYDEAPAESGSSEDSTPAESGSSEPAPAPKEESKPAEAPKTEAPKEEPKAEEPAETPSEEPSAPAETPSQEPAAPAEPSEPAEGEEPEAPAEGEETETPAESETPAEGETPSEEVPSEGGEPPVEGEAPVEGAEPEGHVHTEDCYEYVLICELPEHTHTELCLPQSMMQLLPEGAEIPEGYDNEYSYVDADAGFAVAVYAPDGALPEDAELVAELLEEGSDAHATAAQTLEAMAAQEVAVNVGGVMPESALEEAAENADPDVEYIVEEEPEVPEEEEMGQAPEEPAAPAEPEDGAETPAEIPETPEASEPEAPEASEPEAPVEEPEVPEVTEPEAPAKEPEVEEPAEESAAEPAEEPEEEPAEDESPAESETLTASSIQYDENPADEAPAEEPVVEAPVAEEEPVEEPIVEETPVEEPAEEPVVEEPVVEGPVDETPIEEPVTEGIPAEGEIPAEEVPEEEAVEEEEVVEEAEPVPYEGEFRYDGFVALDIHFELDGEEIEPTKPVFVCINVKGLLPETADPDSVAIQHHVETVSEEAPVEEIPVEETPVEEIPVEEAEVSLMGFVEESVETAAETVVEMVADNTTATGAVEVVKSEETTGMDVATFFAVDSFSTFTVTWVNGGKVLNIHYVGQSVLTKGESLNSLKEEDGSILISKCAAMVPDSFLKKGTNKYINAKIVSNNADVVDPYAIRYNSEESKWQYTVNGTDWIDWIFPEKTSEDETSGANLYLYFGEGMARIPTKINRDINVELFDYGTHINGSEDHVLDFMNSQGEGSRFRFLDGHGRYDARTATLRPEMRKTLVEGYPYVVSQPAREGGDQKGGSLKYLFDKSMGGTVHGSNTVDTSYDITKGKDETTYTRKSYPRTATAADAGVTYDNLREKAVFSGTTGYATPYERMHFSMAGDGGLFQINEKGYYVYDSADNAAYFNGSRFEIYDGLVAPGHNLETLTDTNDIITKLGTGNNANNFMPFDKPGAGYTVGSTSATNKYYEVNGKSVYVLGYDGENPEKATISDKRSSIVNTWYGMTVDFDFWMPKDGIAENGDAMIFDFTGDDDVWVYIDDVLVLDIGGQHGALNGSINFQTGAVKFPGSRSPASESGYTNTNLRDLYMAAHTELVTRNETNETLEAFMQRNGFEKDAQGNWGVTFADYTSHKLNFFYMERGGNIGYCRLNFNMPILPTNSLSVVKDAVDAELLDETYMFQLLNESGAYPTSGTDANGVFTLKAGEMLTFDGIGVNQGDFRVRELIPVDVVDQYDGIYIDKDKSDQIVYSGKEALTSAEQVTIEDKSYYAYTSTAKNIESESGPIMFAFENDHALGNLTIDKDVYVAGTKTDGASFTFDLTVVDDSGATVDLNASYPTTIDGTNVTFVDGEAQISVTAGTSITITGLLAGTKIRVEETNYDGYAPSWSHDDVTYTNGAAASAVTISAGDTATVYFRNTTGPALPNTGGTGTHIYTTLGVVMMLGAGVLLLNQRRRKEADSVT